MPPSPWYALIKGRGPGSLSVFMRHASALGLSQSLVLNLPLALTFLWVLGRFPTSKGRGHRHLQDGNHEGAGEQQPRCERGEEVEEMIRKSVQEGGSEDKSPSPGAPASLGPALAWALQP